MARMRCSSLGCMRPASRISWDCGPRMEPGSGSRIPSTRQPSPPPKRPNACPNEPGSAPCARTRHGKELVRFVAELELGNVYGPTCPVRLVAATLDPSKLDPDNTWYLATSLPRSEATTEQVYEIYRLRDWIEHYYKPAKHELGWADYQMRPERAIVRHWHLVMLAFTRHACSWDRPRLPKPRPLLPLRSPPTRWSGKKEGQERGKRLIWAETLRAVREWLCPWARVQLYWRRWSSGAPPPELAALLDHVARSLPLAAPT